MIFNWVFNKVLFEEMVLLFGIIDKIFDDNEVGEFIVYWLGRLSLVFSEF